MPEMNGVAVIHRARAYQPGLRVMLMSGHADILHNGGAAGIPLLVKPFKVSKLRRRITDVLVGPSYAVGAQKSDSRLLAIPE